MEPRAEEEEEEGVMVVRTEACGGRGTTLCCLNMQRSGRRALLPNYLSDKMANIVMNIVCDVAEKS